MEEIYKGAAANDKTGTPARIAADIINQNFAYLEAKIVNVNQIITAGTYSILANVLTVNAGWVWEINGSEYTNPEAVEITFPYAATDNQRLDRIVCNTSNTFTKVPGTESETNPVAGPLPVDTIEFMLVLVTDSEVGDDTPPIVGENYVDRTSDQRIKGVKTFEDITFFRGDATDDYTGIEDDKFTFWKNQEDEDSGSVSVTAVGDVVGDFTQELQGKDGVIALIEDVDLKVDKVTGKGLSTEDFSTAEKAKLSAISGTNTGDETTSSIQTKRPIRTVEGQSLEGTGNINLTNKEDTSNKTGAVAGNEASTSLFLHIAGMIAYFQQKLTDSIFGTFINSLAAKTTPVDSDSISVVDTGDSNKQKKVSLANFKAYLLTYFDTKYSVPQITITTAVSITTATLDASNYGQKGRHVLIDNGVNSINITINGASGFCCSYEKLGTGTITFVQGSGRTLAGINGTLIMNGAVGSTASLSCGVTIDNIRINNV